VIYSVLVERLNRMSSAPFTDQCTCVILSSICTCNRTIKDKFICLLRCINSFWY